ncbi:DUF1963 domain-containing protein [Streptomyces sp. DH-12]|uniref:DUF1963 domain-containing protein n=1 Tax=unclassified Streptomyces TaxID=2593676 RepID=UPI001F5381AF|nr:DUF1963 domain-containing protein [Streptomyces sp. DH-12]
MTTTLMTYAGPVDDRAPVTRTGGVPLVPAGFTWPRCAECAGPMQFLAQVPADAPGAQGAEAAEHVLSVFMCQNDPGLCDEWDPVAGGNRALVFPRAGLAPAPVPEEGETLLPETCGVDRTAVDAVSYSEARDRWAQASGRPVRDVLGGLGGAPAWLQGDETPVCPSCARAMSFVAQFEEGRDEGTAMNFGGGGCGYAFACVPCAEGAFLWQS